MRVYISGPLTITRPDTDVRSIYVRLGDFFTSRGHDAYVPHLFGDPVAERTLTPKEVWDTDSREVEKADVILAYVGMPSLGTGAELEIARMAGKRVILWKFTGEVVSRMALGNPAVTDILEVDSVNTLEAKLIGLFSHS